MVLGNVWIRPQLCRIAGGTGITVFTAFLSQLKADYMRTITLFYGAKSKRLLLYHEMILKTQELLPNLQANYWLESEGHDGFLDGIHVSTGLLSVEEIWQKLSDPMAYIFYLSVPPEMLKHFSGDLKNLEIPEDHIRIDAWD